MSQGLVGERERDVVRSCKWDEMDDGPAKQENKR